MPALVLAISLLFLQTPKAGIDGMVLRADTNAPIADARVLLYPVAYPPTPLQTVVTDGTGRFSFTGLDAGEYRVYTDIKGFAIDWLAQTLGISAIPGRAITLKDGQRIQDFQYRLTPEGIVAGRVLSATGEPVADVEVQLVIGRYALNGRRTYVTAAALRTNDRGEYRFHGLEPGRFYLRVAAPLVTGRGASQGIADTIGTNSVPTFFPNATLLAEATPLEVKAGSPLVNIDVTLRKRASTRYRIQGRITDARGPLPPGGVQYTFYRVPREGMTGDRFSTTAPDGTFEIPDLDPGRYVIQAQLQASVARPEPGAPRPMFPTLYAFATVDLVSGDVPGVMVTLRSIPLTGKVRMEGQGALPPGLQVRLSASESGAIINSPPPAVVQADGSISFINVSSGADYEVTLTGLPPELYLKEGYHSLRLSDGPVAPLEIVIGTKSATLNGNAPGSSRIALVPSDRLRPDLFRFVTADADGKFSLRGIAPGDYKLFAFEKESEPYAAFDPSFLASRERDVPNILHIEESSLTQVDLRVAPASK